jgi:hypothetical protein
MKRADGVERIEHVGSALERHQETIDCLESILPRGDTGWTHACSLRRVLASSPGIVGY